MKKTFLIILFILLLALVPVGIWQHDNITGFIQSKVNADSSTEQPIDNPPVEKPDINEKPVSLSSGLYDSNDNQIVTWEYLKDNGYISVDDGVLKSNFYVDENYKNHYDMNGHLVIDNEVTSIGENAFCYTKNSCAYNPSLFKVTIPNSVTNICKNAFCGSDFSNLIIPNSVVEIGASAFSLTKISTIDIPSSVKYIGTGAFSTCPYLTSITGLEGIIVIPSNCFTDCINLKNIVIPDNITLIGPSAFQGCSSLEEIVLPDVGLSDWAFAECIRLREVSFSGTCSNYIGGTRVFVSCRSLKKFVFPEGYEKVELSYFDNCLSLEEVILSSTIRMIYCPFGNCPKLLNIFIPKTLTAVEGADDCFDINIFMYSFDEGATLYFEVDDSLTCRTPDLYEYYKTNHNAKFGYTYEEYLTAIGK